MAERIVAHLDMDAFFAACEIQRRPELADVPVVVGGDPRQGQGRGVVTTANYAARVYGIGSGMPLATAWRRCPDAVFLKPDFRLYRETSRRIVAALRADHTIQQASVDEAYLDWTGRVDWMSVSGLIRDVKHTVGQATGGLTCSVGVGPNKLVAKIASERQKPDGRTLVPPEDVLDFLAPLAVGEVPGIGPKTQARLDGLGIRTLAELRAADPTAMLETFGTHGPWMIRAARGVHDAPVDGSWSPRKSISNERTFMRDVEHPWRVTAAVRRLMGDLEQHLAKENYWYRNVAVKVRYADFETHTRQASLLHPARNTWEARRLIPRLLRGLVKPGKAVRLVGVRLGDLIHQLPQRELTSYLGGVAADARRASPKVAVSC